MREGMKLLSFALGIPHLGLRPSSLRAGGATDLLEQTGNLPLVRMRGRWLSERSLEHYVQEAMVTLVSQRITNEAEAKIEEVRTHWPLFRRPPSQPWTDFFNRRLQVKAHLGLFRKALRAKGVVL